MELIKTIRVNKECIIDGNNPTPSKDDWSVLINITSCDSDLIADYRSRQKKQKIKLYQSRDKVFRGKQFVHFVMSYQARNFCCEEFSVQNNVPLGQHFITKIEVYENRYTDYHLYNDTVNEMVVRVYFSNDLYYDAIVRNCHNGSYAHSIEINYDLNGNEFDFIYELI